MKFNHKIKTLVRIGKIEDQDRWRREDMQKLTPDERVDMLLQLQENYFAGQDRTMVRIAHIKR